MSIWDRVGNALKAGAKGAADSILTTPTTSGASTSNGGQVTVQPVEYSGGISTPTPSSWTKWAVPAAAAGLLALVVFRTGGKGR